MRARKLRPGEKPQRGHINQFATAIGELRKQIRQLAGDNRPTEPAAIRAWALNDTGADLRMGDAAAIAGGIATTLARILEDGPILKLRAFSAGSSAIDESGNWVIAANEIKSGEIGRVYVAGICVARATGSGDYADAPDDGAAVLHRTDSGAKVVQEIEETEAGGGENWVLLRIGATAKAFATWEANT